MTDEGASSAILVQKDDQNDQTQHDQNDSAEQASTPPIEQSAGEETKITPQYSQDLTGEMSNRDSSAILSTLTTPDPVTNSLTTLLNSDSGYMRSQRELLKQGEEIARSSNGSTGTNTTSQGASDGSVTSAESITSDSERESSETGEKSDSGPKALKKVFREGGAPNYYLEKKISELLSKDSRLNNERKDKFRKLVKVVTRAVQGIPKSTIAIETGLAVTTISSWTKQYAPIIEELSEVEAYKVLRADVLAALQSRIVRSIPAAVDDADLPQLTRAFDVLSKYERLERGQSTDNKAVRSTTSYTGPEDTSDN